MTPRRLLARTLFALAPLLAAAAHANDTSFGEANGTIQLLQQPDIRMSKEALFISEDLVRVDYVFTNTSTRDLLVPIAFPMPPMYFGTADQSELSEFKLWVDGKPVRTESKLVASLDGADVSRQWAASGWSTDELAAFIDSGQTPKGRKALPKNWFDPDGQPLFTLSEYFTWQQRFAAGKSVSIRHSYAPSLTSGVPQPASDLIRDYAKDTCLEAAAQKSVRRRERAYGLEWSNLRYILLTGNNWKGPIQDFRLTLKKRAPTDIVSLCFDGELKRTDPLTFEFEQKDFVPKQDLNVLFLR